METNTNTQTPVPNMNIPGETSSKSGMLAVGLGALGVILSLVVGVGAYLMIANVDSSKAETDTKITANAIAVSDLKTELETYKTTVSGLLSAQDTKILDSATKADLKMFTDYMKMLDSDNDGINDYDEVTVYKTNPSLKDTDDDGYTDKEEIDGGFNPLGEGKLDLTNDTTAINNTNGKVADDTVAEGFLDKYLVKVTLADDLVLEKSLNDNNLIPFGQEPAGLELVATAKGYLNDQCKVILDGPCGGDIAIYAGKGWQEAGTSDQEFYLGRPGGAGVTYYGPYRSNLEELSKKATDFVYTE